MKNNHPVIILIILLAASFFPCVASAGNFFGIIDYAPSSFVELVDAPFFYSIGKTLRYGRTISNMSPVLFEGSFFGRDLDEKAVYVSPDNKKAAFFYGKNLYLAKTTGPSVLLISNCRKNTYYNKIKVGEIYYSNLQWDAESKFVYMVKDKKHVHTPRSCWHSPEVVLVRIDMDSPTKVYEVIKDFNSLHYFFVGNDTVCYNYALGDGSVVWKCLNRGVESFVASHRDNQILLANDTIIKGKPFESYFGNIYESEIWLTNYGFCLKKINNDGLIGFYSKSDNQKPIFKIQGGYTFKGDFTDGILQCGCKVLPGGRYALLHVWHDNFKGQLLVDGQTGKYHELPAKTNVYLNLNSYNYEHFKFDLGHGNQPEFLPAAKLQTNY